MKFVSLLLLPMAAGLLHGSPKVGSPKIGSPYFEPNRGQSQSGAKFIGRSAHGLSAVESSRLRLRTAGGAAIDVTLDSARVDAEGSGTDPLPGVSHYALTRDPSSWIFGVPHFAAVRFQNVYRNVDLRFHFSGDDVEFDFNAARPSSISQIRLRFHEDVHLSPEGDLVLSEGSVHRPVAWQTIAGKRQPVEVAFRPDGRRLAGFRLGPHDPAQPIVIDPTIDFGTFLGGSQGELDTQLAVDSSGNIYIAGTTMSTDFPAAELPGYPLNVPISLRAADVYITRLKPDASTLDWSFYIGGTATERAAGLALDSIGDIYLYGSTLSANFPVTPNAWRPMIDASVTDTFVAKLNAQTGLLLAATYLGFPLNDFRSNATPGTAFAVDSAGGVYAGGAADASFKPTPGAWSSAANSYAIVRLNAALTSPVYATYSPLGKPTLLQTDAAGNLIVTGFSAYSYSGSFPAINPIDGVNPMFPHDFIAKLNAGGSSIIYASLLPGPVGDVQVDASGNAWITGVATSDLPRVHSLVPAPSPAVQPGILSAPVFFAEIPPQGGAFLQSTIFDSSDYLISSYGSGMPNTRLLLPGGRVCVLNVLVKSPTPGSLLNSQSSQALVCSDASAAAIEMRTPLPAGSYNVAQASPDGAVLLAGSGGRNFQTTPGVVQPAFAGGTFTNDPFTLYGDDAILLRVSFPNPVPAISSVTPDSILLNSLGSSPSVGSLTLLGSGFSYGEQITLNGNPLTVASIASANRITVSNIPLTALHPGANQIVATTSGPGGGVSNSAVVTAYNLTPGPLVVSPGTVTAGSPETKIIVSGTGIIAGSVLTWNGQVRATTFVPSTVKGSLAGSLQFLMEPAEMTQPSVAIVAVSNPAPGGGTSPAARFVVQDASAAAVPSLSATIFVPLSDSTTPDPTVTVTGKGFNVSTTATLDGSAVPAFYVSATQLKITPPAGVLSTLGTHQIQVANAGLTSNVIPLVVERATGYSSFAWDPAKQILYLLVSPNSPSSSDKPYDLQTIDARTGKRTGGISGLISRPTAIAVSADGAYVYVGGGATGLEIMRFNTSTAAVDLDFQVRQAPAAVGVQISALVAIAGAPETVGVAMTTLSQGAFTLSIYDRDNPRPLSIVVPFGYGLPALFATADKIFIVNGSSASCFAWMDFDSSGVEGSTECGVNPPEMRSSHGFVWLTDGVRNATIAAPYAAGNAVQPPLNWQVDPVRSEAWAISASTPVLLYRMDLNTMEQTTSAIAYAGSFSSLLLTGDGTVRMLNSSYLTAPPSPVTGPAAFRPTAIRNPASRQNRRPVPLRR